MNGVEQFKLQSTILKEHSKTQCNKIIEWVGDDQKRFNELFNLFLNGEYRVAQRAAWPIIYCVELHPGFIKKHFRALIQTSINRQFKTQSNEIPFGF